MKLDIMPGTYIVAVSGGVDSIALLDMLAQQPGLKLVVAHFDHGIRPDAIGDRRFVQKTATAYGLPFVYAEGQLGAMASEARGRQARYMFLEKVRLAAGARAVLTAHQADDVLETAILNILRGTGPRGLTSLAHRQYLYRPLLHRSKQEIIAYAEAHELLWREDATNVDDRYARNYIRHRLLSRFSPEARLRLRDIIEKTRRVNVELDVALANHMHLQPSQNEIARDYFTYMPHMVAVEFLASWLRARGLRSFDRKMLGRVTIAAKTRRPGTIIDIMEGVSLEVRKQTLALIKHER